MVGQLNACRRLRPALPSPGSIGILDERVEIRREHTRVRRLDDGAMSVCRFRRLWEEIPQQRREAARTEQGPALVGHVQEALCLSERRSCFAVPATCSRSLSYSDSSSVIQCGTMRTPPLLRFGMRGRSTVPSSRLFA